MRNKKFITCLLALSAIVLWTASSFAKTYNLRADLITKTMPDGTQIPMWGFADDTTAGTGNGVVTVPGPILEIPAGDTTLTINLTNNLPAAVSIVIPGQTASLSPAYFGSGDANYPDRVRSFTAETPPQGVMQYTWTNLRPGTYLYESGTQPQVQVQMGLYGAVKVYAPDGLVYPGLITDAELLFLYSEIDPALHEAVALGQYGPGTAMTSTINYRPKYFLINGQPYAPGQLFANITAANQRVLIRLLSASLEAHVPMLQDNYFSVIAENGQPYTYPKRQYEVLLHPGSTVDAVFTPDANGIFALYDRMLSLANGGASGAGMLVRLNVGAVPEAPLAGNDAYVMDKNAVLNIAAPGVLANDGDANGDAITAMPGAQNVLNGTLVLNPDGSFIYTPTAGFSGVDAFTYTANDATGPSDPATVTISVANTAPAAVAESYSVDEDTLLTVNAPGVLSNDSDFNNDPLTAILSTGTVNGALNLAAEGSFTYMPAADFNGQDSFTYMANDGDINSLAAEVTITINPVNDPPVAVNNNASAVVGFPLVINVLGNDTDVDSAALNVSFAGNASNGTVVINPDNTITFTPSATGLATFNYTANDGVADSNMATVSVVVMNNTRPMAPSGLSATVTPGDPNPSVALVWNDNSMNEDLFTIQRATNTSFTAGLTTFTAAMNATGFTDATALNGARYYYRVQANNAVGGSSWSNRITVNTPAAPVPPAAPSALTLRSRGTTSLSMSWTDNANNEQGFYVERSTNGATWTRISTRAANSRYYTNTGLARGTTYWYRIQAYNTYGASGYSNVITATTR